MPYLSKERNLKLIKRILHEIEQSELGVPMTDKNLYEELSRYKYQEKEVLFHVRLLEEVNLIRVETNDTGFAITGITWNGYEYLE